LPRAPRQRPLPRRMRCRRAREPHVLPPSRVDGPKQWLPRAVPPAVRWQEPTGAARTERREERFAVEEEVPMSLAQWLGGFRWCVRPPTALPGLKGRDGWRMAVLEKPGVDRPAPAALPFTHHGRRVRPAEKKPAAGNPVLHAVPAEKSRFLQHPE